MLLDELFPDCVLDFDDDESAPNEAYMLWLSRGDRPNAENACGVAGPLGKKPATGEEGWAV